MPYIDPHARQRVDEEGPSNVGELTYALYREVVRYLGRREPNGFATRAEVIAALEATKLEFVERHLRRYEENKRVLNGDVP